MSIKYICSSCAQIVCVPPARLGLRVDCDSCGHVFLTHRHVRLACRNCSRVLRVAPAYLGLRVGCKFCDHIFLARLEDGRPPIAPPGRAAAAGPGPPEPSLAAWEGEVRRIRAELAARAAEHAAAIRLILDLRDQLARLQGQLQGPRARSDQAVGRDPHPRPAGLQPRAAYVERLRGEFLASLCAGLGRHRAAGAAVRGPDAAGTRRDRARGIRPELAPRGAEPTGPGLISLIINMLLIAIFFTVASSILL
jgi:hypothetical protein